MPLCLSNPTQNPSANAPKTFGPKQSNIKSADNKRFLILVAKKRGKLAQKRGASINWQAERQRINAVVWRCCCALDVAAVAVDVAAAAAVAVAGCWWCRNWQCGPKTIANAWRGHWVTTDRWPFCFFFCWPKFRDSKAESGTQLATMVLRPGHLPISLLPHMHIYALFCSVVFFLYLVGCNWLLLYHNSHVIYAPAFSALRAPNKRQRNQLKIQPPFPSKTITRTAKCGSLRSKRRNCASKVQHEMLIPISISNPLAA